MRILLVEDDDMIGESVMAGLETEGHAIDWVRDGNSALLALNTTPYSLVILDLGLPGAFCTHSRLTTPVCRTSRSGN